MAADQLLVGMALISDIRRSNNSRDGPAWISLFIQRAKSNLTYSMAQLMSGTAFSCPMQLPTRANASGTSQCRPFTIGPARYRQRCFGRMKIRAEKTPEQKGTPPADPKKKEELVQGCPATFCVSYWRLCQSAIICSDVRVLLEYSAVRLR